MGLTVSATAQVVKFTRWGLTLGANRRTTSNKARNNVVTLIIGVLAPI